MKKLFITLALSFLILPILSNQSIEAKAEEIANAKNQTCAFAVTNNDMLPILIEDNSYFEMTRGAILRVNVNKTYSIYIQDGKGSCSNYAQVRVTGYYTYDNGNGNIVDSSINAVVSSVPTHWNFKITGVSKNVSSSNLSVLIRFESSVDDPYSCMVGGGVWYSAQTIALK
ncbi:hypothetical protein [Anaerorhabdus sp.]|jgi:hypothetical protein|uniref:hypothetical protein n=1 Tax=Anaerorhabdus sp. TaxID=1872524 RepID=UPI002FC8AF90